MQCPAELVDSIVPDGSKRYQDVFYPCLGKSLTLVLSFLPFQGAKESLNLHPADLEESFVLEIRDQPIIDELLVIILLCSFWEVATGIPIPLLDRS